MNAFKAWFSTERRQGIQVFAASLAPLLILFGLGTEGFWEQWLIILGAALQFISNLMNLLNLKQGEWSKGWEITRAAIYTFGMALAPAFVALGYWTEDFSGLILTGAALALSVLGNLISVLTSGKQQEQELLTAITELKSSGR